ncbi:hypothetical protein PHB09_161 [Pseudomonas phage PHB09]|uniref:Uncharacterized protein n=1 Tax=Pseudomonas phage PHB09 TaxID=2867265 RepID=A0AAE8XCY9_9CAUD|nr:hypothetical protein QGX10_gp160 [Pseudomonas phage PHB09]UAV84656.1 hypothetical protein PHB09_161 [Pseudomonas phage PHB09]
MTYTKAMNDAISGHMGKCFGDGSSKLSGGMTSKKRHIMKLVRYLSRSIHGK